MWQVLTRSATSLSRQTSIGLGQSGNSMPSVPLIPLAPEAVLPTCYLLAAANDKLASCTATMDDYWGLGMSQKWSYLASIYSDENHVISDGGDLREQRYIGSQDFLMIILQWNRMPSNYIYSSKLLFESRQMLEKCQNFFNNAALFNPLHFNW